MRDLFVEPISIQRTNLPFVSSVEIFVISLHVQLILQTLFLLISFRLYGVLFEVSAPGLAKGSLPSILD